MKQLTIAILVIALAIVGVGVGVGVYANNPKTVVRNSVGDVFGDLAEREEIKPVVNVLTQGSVDFSLSSEIDEEKAELSGKVYFGEKEFFFEHLAIKAADKKLDANFYMGEEYAYITNRNILGGTYGVVYDDILKNFKKSIFAYGSGSEYAIEDEEIYNAIVDILEISQRKELEEMYEDFNEIYEHYTKFLVKSFENHAEYETSTDRESVGDDYMKARTVAVIITEDTVMNILEDLYKELEDDKDLPKALEKHSEAIISLLAEYSGNEDTNPDEGENEMPKWTDASEMYEEFLSEFETFLDEYDDMEEKPNFKITAKFVTPTTASRLLKFSLTVKEGKEKAMKIIEIDLGKGGVKDSDCITVEMGEVKLKYEISEHTSKEYSSTFKMGYEGQWQTIFKFTIDKKEEYFKFTMPEELGDVTIRGTFEEKGDKTTIGLKKIQAGGETIEGFELKITFEEKDSMPKLVSAKDIKDVFKIKDKDIEEIIANVEKFAEDAGPLDDVLPDIGVGLPGTPEEDDDWYREDEENWGMEDDETDIGWGF